MYYSLLYKAVVQCRCGSGLSGEQLTDLNHYWVGVDISKHMLGKYMVYDEGEITVYHVLVVNKAFQYPINFFFQLWHRKERSKVICFWVT